MTLPLPRDPDNNTKPQNENLSSLKYPSKTEVWFPEDYAVIFSAIMNKQFISFDDREFCADSTACSITKAVELIIDAYRANAAVSEPEASVLRHVHKVSHAILDKQYDLVTHLDALPAVLKLSQFVWEIAEKLLAKGVVAELKEKYSLRRAQYICHRLESAISSGNLPENDALKSVFATLRTDPPKIVCGSLVSTMVLVLDEFRYSGDLEAGKLCVNWLSDSFKRLGQGEASLYVNQIKQVPSSNDTALYLRKKIWRGIEEGLKTGVLFYQSLDRQLEAIACMDDVVNLCSRKYFRQDNQWNECRARHLLERAQMKTRVCDLEGQREDAELAMDCLRHLPSSHELVKDAQSYLDSSTLLYVEWKPDPEFIREYDPDSDTDEGGLLD